LCMSKKGETRTTLDIYEYGMPRPYRCYIASSIQVSYMQSMRFETTAAEHPPVDTRDLQFDTSTYHCEYFQHMFMCDVDPSLAVAMLCTCEDEVDMLADELKNVSVGHVPGHSDCSSLAIVHIFILFTGKPRMGFMMHDNTSGFTA